MREHHTLLQNIYLKTAFTLFFSLISAEINMILLLYRGQQQMPHRPQSKTHISVSHDATRLPLVHGFVALKELELLLVDGSSTLPENKKQDVHSTTEDHYKSHPNKAHPHTKAHYSDFLLPTVTLPDFPITHNPNKAHPTQRHFTNYKL